MDPDSRLGEHADLEEELHEDKTLFASVQDRSCKQGLLDEGVSIRVACETFCIGDTAMRRWVLFRLLYAYDLRSVDLSKLAGTL